MTFEEWWDNVFKAPAHGLMEEHMKEAYEAGLEAGYETGDYLEGFEEGYKAGFNECRDKWGGLDYEQTLAYERGEDF